MRDSINEIIEAMTGLTTEQMELSNKSWSAGIGIFKDWNIVHSGIDELIPIPNGVYPYIYIEPLKYYADGSRSGTYSQDITIEAAYVSSKRTEPQTKIREIATNIIEWIKDPSNYANGICVTPQNDISANFEFGVDGGQVKTRLVSIELTMKVIV